MLPTTSFALKTMRLFLLPVFVLVMVYTSGCADHVTLEGVDAARFSSDKDGCSGYRAQTIGTIERLLRPW